MKKGFFFGLVSFLIVVSFLAFQACTSQRVQRGLSGTETGDLKGRVDRYESPESGRRWRLVTAPVGGQPIQFWQVLAQDSVNDFSMDESPEKKEAQIRDRFKQFSGKGDSSGCYHNMVRVQGQMQDWNITLAAQNRADACRELMPGQKRPWDNKNACKVFDKNKLQQAYEEKRREFQAAGKPTHHAKDFCMDRFEYPNIPGEYPGIMVEWQEAKRICERTFAGYNGSEPAYKRLCTEDEWTFACEGPQVQPYPYGDGYTRDSKTCVSDIPYKDQPFSSKNFEYAKRNQGVAARQIDLLWEGVPSGSQKSCVSSFGAYDLVGNVDEWTQQSRPNRRNYPSVLKGGNWGPFRIRCQPATVDHGPKQYIFYQTGFRCCSDPVENPTDAGVVRQR